MSVEASEVGAEESLSDIIKGAEPKSEPTAKAEPEPKAEAKAEPAKEPAKAEPERGADGKFKAKEPEKAAEPAKEPEKAPEKARPDWVNGLIAERRKRQAAEAAAQQQQPAKKTDIFENPDQAVAERVGERTQGMEAKLFKLSLKAAQASRTDYEEVATAFLQAAERDPRLIDAMRADDDPGEFIYVVGQQLKELGDVGGDIGKYREKVKAEFSTQLTEKDKRITALESELAAQKKQFEDLSTIRGSLNARGSTKTTVAQTDDEDLKSIVRFNSSKTG